MVRLKSAQSVVWFDGTAHGHAICLFARFGLPFADVVGEFSGVAMSRDCPCSGLTN
jgi:hypothetical protein